MPETFFKAFQVRVRICCHHVWQQHRSAPAEPVRTKTAEKVQLCSLQTRLETVFRVQGTNSHQHLCCHILHQLLLERTKIKLPQLPICYNCPLNDLPTEMLSLSVGNATLFVGTESTWLVQSPYCLFNCSGNPHYEHMACSVVSF